MTGLWCAAVLCGALGTLLSFGDWSRSPALLVVAIILIVLSLRIRSRTAYLLIVASGLLIGVYRGSLEFNDRQVIKTYVGSKIVMTGVVVADPDKDSKGQAVIRLTQLEIDGKSYRGETRITLGSSADLRRSDTVTYEGKLTHGFGTFVATMYRPAQLGDVTRGEDTARDVRDWFTRGVTASISSDNSGLGLGFLTGQKSGIATEVQNNLRTIGLSHIIVASGYNLTILVGLARKSLKRISRFSALAGSLGLVGSFMLITGFSPSMTRAGIVALISLAAWYYGRKLNPIVLLLLSAAITVLIKPSYIWGDLGWYLSFLSFVGVLLLGPLLVRYFFADKPSENVLRNLIIETGSAQLMTLPITIFVFETYSPLSLIANILVLPLIPATMLMTFVAGLSGVILPASIAHFIGLPAKLLLEYVVRMSHWLATSPFASGELKLSVFGVGVVYAAIVAGMLYMYIRVRNFPQLSLLTEK